eukprot:TRINITY_DN345_c0_g1_i1.p1 TRINITY_DN345_c0_g1~~TRINITY_DN345_c0_g1_i1.p1  ORF type:complete len:357 (+),score=82.61 TRINITY_DN345_c0_g1_i1:72-1073(+)
MGATQSHAPKNPIDLNEAKSRVDLGKPINQLDRRGWCMLHYAASFGDLPLAQYLLSQHCLVDIVTEKVSQSALQLAAQAIHEPLVDLLLLNGAAVDQQDANHCTALHYALLCQQSHAYMPIVKRLLEAGASPNIRATNHGTALHLAASFGDLELLQALLSLSDKQQADVNARTTTGQTPLVSAIYGRHLSAVRLLLDKDAIVDAADNEGNTALHVACYLGLQDIGEMLVQAGANIEAVNGKKATPLLLAVFRGMKDMTAYLLENRANVNHRNESQLTSLHIAAMLNEVELVILLIQHNAVLTTFNEFGETPLQNAEQLGFTTVASLLKRLGAR